MNNLLGIFQSFRRILCVCPHCGNILRLSDLRLKYKGMAPQTWIDKYESKIVVLEKKEERFDEKEQKLREKAVERGRKKVPMMIRKSLCREIAMLNYNPYDIKAIFHPIDFIVFNGLNDKEKIQDIILLSKKTLNRDLNIVRKTIKTTIDNEKYNWQVARISADGKIEFER